MALKLVPRSKWGARSAKGTIQTLGSTLGVKVHYTGSPENPRMLDDHSLCDDRVRAIQNGHMDGNGWNDIGYTALVCVHGYVYVGRGPNRLPAANGSGLNHGHYAVCALIGNSGLTKPTNALLHGIRDAIEWLREEGEAGNQIKGHRDGFSTDCPGDTLYAWVKKGAPRPGADTEEDDLASQETINAIAEAVKNVPYNARGDLAKQSWQAALDGMADLRPRTARLEAAVKAVQEEQAAQRAMLEETLSILRSMGS